MLKITLHDSASELRFTLEGKLAGPWVGELGQCWRTALSIAKERRTVVDLRDVDFVDEEGQALLAEMHQKGVALVAVSPLMRAIVDDLASRGRYDTVEEPSHVARSQTAGRPDTGAV